MHCPRCGEALESYRLEDAETVACSECTYVGVPVDHSPEPNERESWDEAISRFYERDLVVREVTEIDDDLEVFPEEATDDEPTPAITRVTDREMVSTTDSPEELVSGEPDEELAPDGGAGEAH